MLSTQIITGVLFFVPSLSLFYDTRIFSRTSSRWLLRARNLARFQNDHNNSDLQRECSIQTSTLSSNLSTESLRASADISDASRVRRFLQILSFATQESEREISIRGTYTQSTMAGKNHVWINGRPLTHLQPRVSHMKRNRDMQCELCKHSGAVRRQLAPFRISD